MVKTGSRFDVARLRKLGEAKFGPRFTDQIEWARHAGVSLPTLRNFLDEGNVKLGTVDLIAAPFGLTAVDLILRNGKK